jgi:hypothetical protein
MTDKKRYEFTGETKTDIYGRTFRQIRALVAIRTLQITVNVGDLGGWIESEANLPHDGTAWVCPRATVAGKYTILRGGTFEGGTFRGGTFWGGTFEGGTGVKSREPLFVSGISAWTVTMTDEHMTVGCQTHTIKEWLAFKESDIEAMSGTAAVTFWKQHKAMLKTLAKATGRL